MLTPLLLAAAVVSAAVPPADPLAGPDRPLDPRIDATKITESDPAPLPARVLVPMPPVHRIAARAQDVPVDAAVYDTARKTLARGAAALIALQDPSGGWMIDATTTPTDAPGRASPVSVAATALVLKALAQADEAVVKTEPFARGLAYIATARISDGDGAGGYEGGELSNYVTSVVVSSLAAIDRDRFHDEIADGLAWLQMSQWDQGEGLAARQDWFGGAGYGSHGRPDMSNTQLMLDAMYDSQMSPDEPAFQKALAFLTRAQNLKQTNPAAWSGDDGGFVYTPANGGESMASQFAGEGRRGEHVPEGDFRSLRSYGSMSYAGFKSMLYAGLSAEDVRVRSAFRWMRRHWTFDENPGVGQQGLYYYYHTMSRALWVAQQDRIVDADGVAHDWRAELVDAIAVRQRPDGTWRNAEDRWLENRPALASAFAMLALEEAIKGR